MTRFIIPVFCIVLLGLICGCTQQAAQDTREEDERAIRELGIEIWEATEAKDLERLMSFIAEDAMVLYPNTPILNGKDAIREIWRAYFAMPDFAMSGKDVKVEVSRSGDLAYVQGTCSSSMNDAVGKPITDKGKYIGILKKQADGEWKIAADIYNSDLPAPEPSTE